MTPQEAKKILHPETSLEAYAETDYYGGFSGAKKWKEAVNEACLVACEALEKQIPKKPKGDYHSVPHYRCPSCNSAVKVFEDAHEYHWCLYCGQALDWSDTK